VTAVVPADTAVPPDTVLDVLVEAGRLDARDRARPWALRQLAGGWSRHTWLLSAGDPAPGQAFVVRVKPPASLLDSDLEREYRLYATVAAAGVPVPTPHGIEHATDTPLGGSWFVMDWVPGSAPVTWLRRDREALEADWADGGRLGRDLVETIAGIHAIPAADLGFLGPPRSYADAVDRWARTYAEDRLVRDPVVEDAFAWLREREPDPVPPALVHGDYRIGNTMIHEGRIAAVVDWELAYLGDPRYDLGYAALDYLAGKFIEPGSALLEAVCDRDWFFRAYERLRATTVDPEVVRSYSVLGALALICILLTGIRTYADGRTTDVRMAWNRYAVPGLRQDLVRLMGW
jgi:aminoglycoside phosphotransferase (APT) family kinase protein